MDKNPGDWYTGILSTEKNRNKEYPISLLLMPFSPKRYLLPLCARMGSMLSADFNGWQDR